MAKTETEPIGRSGSQFFVVYAADAGLQPQFAVLGKITAGIEVIDRIAELREPGSDTGEPLAPRRDRPDHASEPVKTEPCGLAPRH